MIIVYSMGGSFLAGQSPEGLKKYAEELKSLSKDHRIYVVVGGGRVARDYITKARALGASEVFCDEIGIGATKLNSALLIAALGTSAPQEIPNSYARAALLSCEGQVVVMGGLSPGQTTDAVSAMLAEYVRADRLVIATSVDGVYSSDPEVDPGAKKFERLTSKDLVSMAMATEMKAGSRSPIDPLAAKIIERSSLPTVVVDGREVANIRKGALGGHTGTEIRPV